MLKVPRQWKQQSNHLHHKLWKNTHNLIVKKKIHPYCWAKNSIVYVANEVRPKNQCSNQTTNANRKVRATIMRSEWDPSLSYCEPIKDSFPTRNEVLIFCFFFVLQLHFAAIWTSLHVSNGREYLFVIIWITGKNPYITNTNKKRQQTKSLNHKPAKCTSTSV